MKSISFVSIIVISLAYLAAQEKKSPELENYIELMNTYKDQTMIGVGKDTSTISVTDEKELKRIAKILFESNIDPIGIRNEKIKSKKESKTIADKNKLLGIKITEPSFGWTELKLLELLKEKYSETDYNLIITQSIVKGKVLSQKEIPNRASDNPNIVGGPQKIFCKVLVEDIIKGDNLIKTGDIIDIAYNAYFTHRKWELDGSFLFCLFFTISKGQVLSKGKPFRIIQTLGESKGYFPVKENILIDQANYFEQGTSVEWDTFRANLKSRINNILF